MTYIEFLQRQLDEIDALLSVYSDDGLVTFSESESLNLQYARELAISCSDVIDSDVPALSGCIQLPETKIQGQAVTIRFTLPSEYPSVQPAVQLLANATRDQLGELSKELAACVAEHEGSECLLLCVDHMIRTISDKIADGSISSGNTRATDSTAFHTPGPSMLSRAVVWFHHIASPKKRRAMAAWSSELKVGGYSKIGYPGVLMLEGAADAVAEYITRLRSLRWKAMAVRGELQVEFPGEEDAERGRVLPKRIVELEEDKLGHLGDACRAAGLESLFLLALKIERSDD